MPMISTIFVNIKQRNCIFLIEQCSFIRYFINISIDTPLFTVNELKNTCNKKNKTVNLIISPQNLPFYQ